ncbi:MAG: ImmA/IrrE family metallo-endopeptidase [Nanoarchaeota archaeon]
MKKNAYIKEAINIAHRFDVSVRFVKMDSKHFYGFSEARERKIFISDSIKKTEEILSTIFHEIGHVYCYDNNIFPLYHKAQYKNKFTINEKKGLWLTALRAERYVDEWAKKQMNNYFPEFKFKKTYNDSDSKKFIKNHLKEIFNEK